jgi:hypothetical protein
LSDYVGVRARNAAVAVHISGKSLKFRKLNHTFRTLKRQRSIVGSNLRVPIYLSISESTIRNTIAINIDIRNAASAESRVNLVRVIRAKVMFCKVCPFKPMVGHHSKVAEVNYTIPPGRGDIRRGTKRELKPLISKNGVIAGVHVAILVDVAKGHNYGYNTIGSRLLGNTGKIYGSEFDDFCAKSGSLIFGRTEGKSDFRLQIADFRLGKGVEDGLAGVFNGPL